MAKDIFIGHAVTEGMPFDPHAVSAAGNLAELGILTAEESTQQQHLLGTLTAADLPGIWGIHRVACEV